MKITIAGLPGSGKSTISKMLAKELNLENFSIGKIMREMAVELGKSLQEFTGDAKADKEIDFELDRRQRALNSDDSNFVMDSRLGFYFIPDSFKVFLKVDMDEAARRIFGDIVNRPDEDYDSVEAVKAGIAKRVEKSDVAYQKHYGISFLNEDNYDLILDSTDKTAKEIVGEILDAVRG